MIEATMSTWRFEKLLLDKYCLASEREAISTIPMLSPLSIIVTRPLIMTPSYSMKISTVKTYTDRPETAKFTTVFTGKRFLLYSMAKNNPVGTAVPLEEDSS